MSSFDASRDVQDRAEWLAEFAAEHGYESDQLTTVGFSPTSLAPGHSIVLEVATKHMPISYFIPRACRGNLYGGGLFAIARPQITTRAAEGDQLIRLAVKNISDENQQIRVDLVCRVEQ